MAETILVVEDEISLQETLAYNLNETGIYRAYRVNGW
jgi:DNA-binding response OmpR family regulator